ncbi:MAG: LON peptidase substrate-binding domain-containing protein, partial [Pseudomonadota bacterium]
MTDKKETETQPTDGIYPVLPLRDIVVFPHMIVPLFVGRAKSVKALEQVMKDDRQILLASQKDAADDEPTTDGIYDVGTLARVLQLLKLPDGTVKVLVEGRERARIERFTENEEFFEAEAGILADEPADEATLEALARQLVKQFERYVKLNKNVPEEALANINEIDDAAKLADTVAGHLGVKLAERQKLLEEPGIGARLEKIISLIQGEVSVLQVEKKIKSRVKSQMEKTQREYYLNEQMKAIQRELGDGEDGRDELAEYEDRIEATKFSKEAKEKALTELKKLKQMSPMSAESTVV